MRYNPRTDNAMDMDEIARQCMAAVIAATTVKVGDVFDDEYHGDINHGNLYPQGWSFQ